MTIKILVEMLNIVGERERPNLGFARDIGLHNAAISAQLSFREARQIQLSPFHAYCQNGEQSDADTTDEPLSAQESHGHDVLFPSLFDDEGHLLWTDP